MIIDAAVPVSAPPGNPVRLLLLSIGIGVVAGVLSGLLGVGGGIIMVPAMVFLLGFTQHRAHGTSLAVILFVAAAGVISYARAGEVAWNIALGLAVGGILGALLGARLAYRVNGQQLRRYFGAFMVLVALRLLYDVVMAAVSPQPAPAPEATMALGAVTQIVVVFLIGLAAGVLSGLLGVGGGIVMVPAMVLLLGLKQQLAQGISLAVIIPTAISGAIVHYRKGNIRPVDVLWLALGGIPGGLCGAWLANWLPSGLLRGLFGVLLIVLGITMVRARPRP